MVVTGTLPPGKAFFFFVDLGKPTGDYASSIFEFADLLKRVQIDSVSFHLKRGDFSKWLREVIGDRELAKRFEEIAGLSVPEDKLRALLTKVSDRRCEELRS